ncbi:hypothetical protein LOZ22_001917 [Ophidiomyces ophidiicola]|nr:hypothetical protein LOZ22_001917 [Ophidiomyces ophidiicola]
MAPAAYSAVSQTDHDHDTPANHHRPRALSIRSLLRAPNASPTARYAMLHDDHDDDFDCPRSPARRRAPPAPVHAHVKNALMATGSAARPATPPINILLPPPLPPPPPPPPPPNTQPAPPPDAPDEPLLHSPPSARPPLCHPTPDLQALQGAYVSNVERLEQTAERLSLALERRHDSIRSGIARRAPPPDRPPALGSPLGSLLLASRRPSYNSPAAAAAEHTPIRPRAPGYASSIHSSSSLRQSARPSLSSLPRRPSLRSGSMASRLARVVEPPGMTTTTIPPQLPELPLSPPHDAILGPLVADGQEELEPQQQQQQLERPGSAGSGDTYRQATELFKDFDGVHYTPHSEPSQSRRVSLAHPPQPPPLLAGMPNAHQMPARGENMVYYPAPVPMMLNLPQRLSKRPVDQEKRRTQVMSSLPPDKRKSAIWANPIDGDVDPAAPTAAAAAAAAAAARQSKRISQMPPQLRASAFFEVPPTQLDITVKENSAVATLDSILDAAALAPVSAFTDHPIVGQAGAGVYGKERGKKKGKLEKKKRDSDMPIAGEGPNQSISTPDPRASFAEENQAVDEQTPFRSSNDRDREDPDRYVGPGEPKSDDRAESDNDENADDDDEEDEEDAFVGPPTTLLAELQMRKQEQKQRNRTAATAFPNGMHSTLLELDAVAQRQRDNRDRRHVVLAWEDPALADRREPDDDDVPLALLFPDKNKQADENRPLGLMEKLELDENEPLSRRRARIRGEPAPLPRPLTTVYPPAPQQQHNNHHHHHHRASTAFTLDVPGLEESDGDDHEHETLAQRVRRLKTQDEKGASPSAAAAVPGSSDFASELLSRFGDEPPADTKPASPEEEETLGQRRKRLQAEAQAQAGGHKVAAARRSMANILHASPVGMQPPAAVGSRQSLPASGAGYANNSNNNNNNNNNPRLSRTLTGGGPPLLNFGQDMSQGPTPYYPTGLVAPAFGNGLSAVNLNPHFYAAQHQQQHQQQMMMMMRRGTEAEPVIDQSQRDMIDRWRLGVQ